MTALPTTTPAARPAPPADADQAGNGFLKYLPAVQTHANIQFRQLPEVDREEAVAEAVAAAYLNFASAERRGKDHAIKPGTLATYAVRHVRDGRHVGGSREGKRDVFNRRAQRAGRYKVHRFGHNNQQIFDCMSAPDQPVWRLVLLEDRRTPIPDQVAFRVDWSVFLSQQTDRVRQMVGLLAAGYRQIEVAEKLGVTPAAVCQRTKKVERDWLTWQGSNANNGQPEPVQRVCQSS